MKKLLSGFAIAMILLAGCGKSNNNQQLPPQVINAPAVAGVPGQVATQAAGPCIPLVTNGQPTQIPIVSSGLNVRAGLLAGAFATSQAPAQVQPGNNIGTSSPKSDAVLMMSVALPIHQEGVAAMSGTFMLGQYGFYHIQALTGKNIAEICMTGGTFQNAGMFEVNTSLRGIDAAETASAFVINTNVGAIPLTLVTSM